MMRILISTFILFSSLQLFATHNRAGEITYIRTGDFTIQATITTYTRASSTQADRDSLEIRWGDGSRKCVRRVNGALNSDGIPEGEFLGNDVKFNTYVATHTYSSYGDYALSMTDPNRNAGINNVNPPDSDNVSFHLQSECSLLETYDDSPVFLEKPIDNGSVGQPFMHTPNAYDADGDSLAYRMVVPFQDLDQPVSNYLPLTDFGGTVSFDEATGLLIWDTPEIVGQYVVTIEVLSYRNGVQIGSVIRDMSFIISDAINEMSSLLMTQFLPNDFTTVEVGDEIQFLVIAEDLDNTNELKLTATSGLYDSSFSETPVFTIFFQGETVVESNFLWKVTAEHVREQPYQIVFKVSDDFGLANYVVLRFKVAGELTAVSEVSKYEKVNLYPNPTSDLLYLESDNFNGQTYEVWNLNGKRSSVGQVSGNGTVDVSENQIGIYVIRFENGSVAKFTKE